MEPKTIRFYERAALMSRAASASIGMHSSKDVELLKVIKFFRALDMSIKIIRDLLDAHGRLRLDSLPSEAKNAIGSQLKKRQEEYARLEKLCARSLTRKRLPPAPSAMPIQTNPSRIRKFPNTEPVPF